MEEISNIIMLLLGGISHLMGTLAEESKQAGHRLTIFEFSNMKPYRLTYGLAVSVAAYVFIADAGQLTTVSAFAAGYMGDSVVKKIMALKGEPKI